MATPVPATLIAGFLGSGKTTLLNRVLVGRPGERVAVIVNEFGEVGIDGRLVVETAEQVVQLDNGCLCCEVRGDLVGAIERILGARGEVSRLLVEASGLASPGPIAQTMVLHGGVKLEGIVTLCHAGHISDQLGRHPEAAEQVAYADLLLLNHGDAEGADLDAAERALRLRNAVAPLRRTTRADCDVGWLLDRPHGPEGWRLEDLGEQAVVDHTHGIGTVVLRSRARLDLHKLKIWIQFLASRRTHELYRVKGLIACEGHPRSVLVQGAYQWLEVGPGPEELPAESVLVLIGCELDEDEVRRGWLACEAGT